MSTSLQDRNQVVHAFRSRGVATVGGGNRAIELSGVAALVTSGVLDLFAVPVDSGGFQGRRRHLFRVRCGEAVFAPREEAPGESVVLLGIGAGEVTLIQLPWFRLDELFSADDLRESMHRMIEVWVDTVHHGLVSRRVPPSRLLELDQGVEARLASGDSARPVTGVAWVRHLEGSSKLLGLEPLRVNGTGWLPITSRSWLEATEKATLCLAATDDLGHLDRSYGLRQLHRLVLDFAAHEIGCQDSAEQGQARRRDEADRDALATACRHLASTLQQRPEPTGVDDDDRRSGRWTVRDLAACCRTVAHASGIQLQSSPLGEEADSIRALRALGRGSRFRTRRVALRGEWWRTESGALLAFRGDGQTPVALIPRGRGGYSLQDGGGDARQVVASVAATLSPFAYSFYRPFPERALRLWDVLRFGLVGGRRDLAMLVLAGAMAGLLGVVTPVATGVVFNTLIPAADRGQLLHLVLVLLVCGISASVFQLVRGIAQLRLESRMGAAVQAAVWDRLLGLPISFFRPYSAGDLAVRAMGIDTIRQTLSGATMTAVLGGVFSAANFALLFYYSVRLAAWATLLALTAASVTLLVSWAQLRYQRRISRFQQEISGQVLQFLGSVAKLHVAGAEAHAFAAWARKFAAQRALQYRTRRIGNALIAFNAAFPVLSLAIIFAVAGPLLSGDSALRTGDFLAFLSSFTIFLSAVLSMTSAVVGVLTVIPLYENARPILESVPEVDAAKTEPGVLSGEIEATHLAFRYEAGGPLILRDLSFHVRAGEFVAFVGPSGTGKSTIFRLLLGFESPENGSIYFDGQELGGLDVQAVRQQIGVVLQNGKLMPGDIFTNIVGSTSATLDDAWVAARMAGLEEDIRQMPMGMHTVISEGGGTLSGGQRQRLMIARAVVNRPRILLFDEATSALDNRTQAIVSQSLERLRATRIVIAHRLSTIINADRILVFEGGRIVESGTYPELMERRGPFAELAARQLL